MERAILVKIPALMSSVRNQLVNSIGRAMFKFCVFVQPILTGFLMAMLYQNKSNQDFSSFAYLGSGIMTFWSSMAFSSAADIQRERWYGTLENLFACPAGFKTAILGKIIGNTIWGLFSFVMAVSFVRIFFHRPLIIADTSLFFTGLILMLLSFTAIAFMIAGLFTLSRKSRVFMNVLEHPVYILCGVAFPVELLPVPLQFPSIVLAPRWVVEILRASVRGETFYSMRREIIILVFITAAYWLIGLFAYKQIDKKCRINASLGVY